jgi:heme-degrading monooxygenase HmoA
MIVRIFRVTVHAGKRAAFERFFLDTGIPLTRRQPGLVSLTAGLPRPETPNDFALVMVWQDLPSMKAFVGEDWQSAHIHPDEADMVRERQIDHYELVEG